ncbi:hypothetical protein AG1IA_04322 [Rhizoctonia solani AG-1 IA]|uniref:Uncharacterized protein n=1 Tax=Thanatephorus cucumeris (strain AG1-IA) TaxID=983506 RepID=L8WU27_THACA|nr:hypothetical protein AG1IA_04322 [Rhizoctonia solani AG-1 IA]
MYVKSLTPSRNSFPLVLASRNTANLALTSGCDRTCTLLVDIMILFRRVKGSGFSTSTRINLDAGKNGTRPWTVILAEWWLEGYTRLNAWWPLSSRAHCPIRCGPAIGLKSDNTLSLIKQIGISDSG